MRLAPEAINEQGERLCVPSPMGCGKPIGEFRDELSLREYKISGWCQNCQDIHFAEPGEDEIPDMELPGMWESSDFL